MRQAMVAGNWKLNGNLESIRTLIDGLKQGIGSVTRSSVVVCPPFIYLSEVAGLVKGSKIGVGAQNISEQSSGAYTGEIAGDMAKDIGCEYAIIGHSERRALYGETNELVAEKFAAAQKAGLIPILCVGEQLDERERNVTEKVVGRQLAAVIQKSGIAALSKAILAYEPVWAIGTGKTATPDQAQAVHAFMRSQVSALDASIADSLSILYGGSVKAANAEELFAKPDIDGGLIGGASLDAEGFLAICRAVK